jgi:hypothetical protein
MNLQVSVNAVNNGTHCTVFKGPRQTFAKHARVLYEPGTTKLLFFFSSGQKCPFFSPCGISCDQQRQRTQKKKDVSKSGINLVKKITQQSPITILPMFLAGIFSHKNEAVLCWAPEGFYMGMAYGKLQCYGVGLRE